MIGKANHPMIEIWRGMIKRCHLPTNKDFQSYGARGITVCDAWHDFETFVADMGERPAGKSIDRIDNDGPYAPWNCRWATPLEQQQHTRQSVYVDTPVGQMCLAAACRHVGIAYKQAHLRMQKGKLIHPDIRLVARA